MVLDIHYVVFFGWQRQYSISVYHIGVGKFV